MLLSIAYRNMALQFNVIPIPFGYLLVVHWWHYGNLVAFLRFLINPWEFRCIPKVLCDRYYLEFWNHHKKIFQIQDGNWKAEIHPRIMQKYITKDFSGAPSVILLRFLHEIVPELLAFVTPSETFLEISLWNAVEVSLAFLQVFFKYFSDLFRDPSLFYSQDSFLTIIRVSPMESLLGFCRISSGIFFRSFPLDFSRSFP